MEKEGDGAVNDSPEQPLNQQDQKLDEIKEMLMGIGDALGRHDPVPTDPRAAARHGHSLYWLISHLSEGVHALNNYAQSLGGLVEQLERKLDRNAAISQENAQALKSIKEAADDIQECSASIAKSVGVVVKDKPLLMRELFWMDTNATELHLILLISGEAMIFFAGSDALVRSAMFLVMSRAMDVPAYWGLGCLGLWIIGVVGFLSRRNVLRTFFAFCAGMYFLGTGLPALVLASGVLGWLPHVIAGSAAAWIVYRGPANAI